MTIEGARNPNPSAPAPDPIAYSTMLREFLSVYSISSNEQSLSINDSLITLFVLALYAYR